MNSYQTNLSAPKRLALAYARNDLRDGLGIILMLDNRLAGIFDKAGEPLIAQMRLAWWNDVIAKPAKERPAGELLLAILAEVEANNPAFNIASAMQELIEAWDMLLSQPDWSSALLSEHTITRSSAVFGWYARMTGANSRHSTAVNRIGVDWAFNDLLCHCRNETEVHDVKAAQQVMSSNDKLPRSLRPLSIIAKSARYRVTPSRWSGIRLIIHALTGW
jgi:15-cis-phytoene synthase